MASGRLASRVRCCCGGGAGRCVGRAGRRAAGGCGAARGTADARCLRLPAMNSLDQAEGECSGSERARSCLFGAPGASGSAPGLPERAASSLRSGPHRGAALRGVKQPREASAPSPVRSRGRRSSPAQTGELGPGLWCCLRILRLGDGLLLLSGRPAEAESGARREGLCCGFRVRARQPPSSPGEEGAAQWAFTCGATSRQGFSTSAY